MLNTATQTASADKAAEQSRWSADAEHEEAMLDLYCITALMKLVAHDEHDKHRGCVRDYLNEKLEETYAKLDGLKSQRQAH